MHFLSVKIPTLSKMGLVQTTKPHQKGLTTPQVQKGANIPLNPEKGAKYPPTPKNVYHNTLAPTRRCISST